MLQIGLIREGKVPADNRVALTPVQCKWLQRNMPVYIKVQHSETRCFKDREYTNAGIEHPMSLSTADLLKFSLGIANGMKFLTYNNVNKFSSFY